MARFHLQLREYLTGRQTAPDGRVRGGQSHKEREGPAVKKGEENIQVLAPMIRSGNSGRQFPLGRKLRTRVAHLVPAKGWILSMN